MTTFFARKSPTFNAWMVRHNACNKKGTLKEEALDQDYYCVFASTSEQCMRKPGITHAEQNNEI
jgi:hypothetical protein